MEKPLRRGQSVHDSARHRGVRSPLPLPHPSLLRFHFALPRNRLVGRFDHSEFGTSLSDFPISHPQNSCSQVLYMAAIACFTLGGLMFALLIVRIEIGSETSEDVLHQIAVGFGGIS